MPPPCGFLSSGSDADQKAKSSTWLQPPRLIQFIKPQTPPALTEDSGAEAITRPMPVNRLPLLRPPVSRTPKEDIEDDEDDVVVRPRHSSRLLSRFPGRLPRVRTKAVARLRKKRQSGGAQPSVSQPGYAQPGYAQPGYAQSRVTQSRETQPGVVQTGQPGSRQPGSGQPGSGQPQYGPAQNGQSQYGQAQYGQAQYGQSQYGQSQYGQSQYGQSQYGQSPYGQSPYGLQYYGQSQHAQSQFQQSQYAQSQHAQSQHAQSQHAQSQHAQSQHAQSQYAQPQYGQSLSTLQARAAAMQHAHSGIQPVGANGEHSARSQRAVPPPQTRQIAPFAPMGDSIGANGEHAARSQRAGPPPQTRQIAPFAPMGDSFGANGEHAARSQRAAVPPPPQTRRQVAPVAPMDDGIDTAVARECCPDLCYTMIPVLSYRDGEWLYGPGRITFDEAMKHIKPGFRLMRLRRYYYWDGRRWSGPFGTWTPKEFKRLVLQIA